MKRLGFTLVTCGVAVLIQASFSPAADIVYVHQNRGQAGEGTGTAPGSGQGSLEWEDDQWRVLIEGAGHNIIEHAAFEDLDVNPAGLDVLNSADLVIFSRDTNSGDYNEPDEQEAWAEGVTVPMLVMTPFTIRNNRWDFTESSAIQEMDDGVDVLIALEPEHPLFAGVLDENNEAIVWDEDAPFLGPDGLEADSIDFLNIFADDDNRVGNGQVLAVEGSTDVPWIIYWEADSEYYDNSLWTAPAPRLYYSVGSDDDPYSWGEKNITPAGDQIFLNAIAWLTGDAGGVPGDFDGSGALDVADINALTTETAKGMAAAGSFDLTGDGNVDTADINAWVELANTWIGDANLDGEFNSGDLVAVFTAGKFETGQAAVWSEGDWDGSGAFDSGDFVAAFTGGGFEQGPRAAAAAVPEPSSMLLLASGWGALAFRRRR